MTGTAVAQWLRYCATNQKVAGSIQDVVMEFFVDINPSDRTMALGSTQPLTEMSTRIQDCCSSELAALNQESLNYSYVILYSKQSVLNNTAEHSVRIVAAQNFRPEPRITKLFVCFFMFCWPCCHLGIFLVNDQLDAQFLFLYVYFNSLHVSNKTYAHHQENQLYQYNIWYVSFWPCSILGKSVPLQAWHGPEGSRKLTFPDFLTVAQYGGKVVSLTHRPPLPPENTPGTHFC
jgi:hypothetical protein